MARLILWDIDGTLLESGGATLQVFNRAVELALGRHPGEHGVSFSGGTDPLIARGILASLEVEDGEVAALVPAILGHLETEMAAVEDVIRRRGRVLPGVPAVLERLAAEPGVHQSVLTGNIAPNAAVKLRAFDLDRWLDLEVGAYGSDHHDRNELVPVAVERLGRLRDVEVAPDDVWVVGDTVRDLDCARAGGAHAVLVATGRIPRDELAAAGPDYLFDDLADVDGVASLLGGSDLAGQT